MKRVEAIIQPHRLKHVVWALHELPSFPGFTIMDAHGQGRGKGKGGHFIQEPDEGLVYHKRRIVVVVCEDKEAPLIVQLIAKAAHTGRQGDGFISVTDIADIVRIRNGGADA